MGLWQNGDEEKREGTGLSNYMSFGMHFRIFSGKCLRLSAINGSV